MSAIKSLMPKRYRAVEAEGVHWRLLRIRSRELLEAGGNGLMAVLPRIIGQAKPDMAAILAELAANPELIAAEADRELALLIASVDAVSTDGETWEACRLVLTEEEADPEKGLVPISVLSDDSRRVLSGAVQEHSLRSPRGSLQ